MTNGIYIWTRDDWPNLHWNMQKLSPLFLDVIRQEATLRGKLSMLQERHQEISFADAAASELIASSSIEGIRMDRNSVRSSILNKLGIQQDSTKVKFDHYNEGTVTVLLDAVENWNKPLTRERLFSWHSQLFPFGISDGERIATGCWRSGPMYVVSGRRGKEIIHYEAPPAGRIESEIDTFLDFVNGREDIDPFIKAAVAHFWFVTIHPFADGNGRIARTISELLLARADKSSRRFYSLSEAILANKNEYYEILESCEKGTGDITSFVEYILKCLASAVDKAEEHLSSTLAKTRFWDSIHQLALNERQIKIINRVLDGFDDKLTAEKWAKITKCSHATALRDITDLIAKGVLEKDGSGGRSAGYQLRSRNMTM